MSAIETLISVLCGPDGKCSISGSDDDRRLIDSALAELAQATAAQAVVPAGWKLVPTEPTQAMLDAVVTSMDDFLLGKEAEKQYREDWAAMLAATQPAPVLWVSPEQFANFMDADEAQFGRYVPAPVGAEPVALLVRKNSWRDGQWEVAPPNSPSYGLAWANQRMYVYATPQPTQTQPVPLSAKTLWQMESSDSAHARSLSPHSLPPTASKEARHD